MRALAVLAGGGWAVLETLEQGLRGARYAPGANAASQRLFKDWLDGAAD